MLSRSELLLDRFAEKIGVGFISFNENRLCSFAIDEIYYISLSDANDEYMMIYGVCGKFPTDNPNFALEILNANFGLQRMVGHTCVMSQEHNRCC